jgi:alginate O-acetyltransferase complex protein AlgI
VLFNSLEFALFFAAVFVLSLVLPHRAQNRMFLAASYLFYGAWDWRFLGLIALSTLIDFGVGLRLSSVSDPRIRKGWVTLSVVTNLGILGAFKYAGFFAESLADLLAPFGVGLSPFIADVALPVGISFYTFQSLSYTIDIYRDRLEPTRDLLDFALFVAFFPQLVAGPIERARRLLPQILEPRERSFDGVSSGLWLVLWGTFKKVVIADNLAPLVDAVYAPGATPTGLEVTVATYAFAIQIYCDFSGYTDVARGTARMLGFDLMLNFRLPYFASSPAEFWRRWHISLSTWLRDYLYISLGGNRRGNAITLRNLALTMLLGGLWHGAAWTFVLWGAFHGGLLIAQRLLQPRLPRILPPSGAARSAWTCASVILTFHLVCLGWLFFRADSLTQIGALLGSFTAGLEPGLAGQWIGPLALLSAPLLLVQMIQLSSGRVEAPPRISLPLRFGVAMLAAIAIVLLGEDFGEPFIYFQF